MSSLGAFHESSLNAFIESPLNARTAGGAPQAGPYIFYVTNSYLVRQPVLGPGTAEFLTWTRTNYNQFDVITNWLDEPVSDSVLGMVYDLFGAGITVWYDPAPGKPGTSGQFTPPQIASESRNIFALERSPWLVDDVAVAVWHQSPVGKFRVYLVPFSTMSRTSSQYWLEFDDTTPSFANSHRVHGIATIRDSAGVDGSDSVFLLKAENNGASYPTPNWELYLDKYVRGGSRVSRTSVLGPFRAGAQGGPFTSCAIAYGSSAQSTTGETVNVYLEVNYTEPGVATYDVSDVKSYDINGSLLSDTKPNTIPRTGNIPYWSCGVGLKPLPDTDQVTGSRYLRLDSASGFTLYATNGTTNMREYTHAPAGRLRSRSFTGLGKITSPAT